MVTMFGIAALVLLLLAFAMFYARRHDVSPHRRLEIGVQAVSAIAVVVGVAVAAGTYSLSQRGQITDRFSRAVEQLGATGPQGEINVPVRVGGIYALEQVAKDSPIYRWTVVELLSTYVRTNAPCSTIISRTPPENAGTVSESPIDGPKTPTADVQAALTVIVRRDRREQEKGHVNLSRTNLRGADLENAHLEHALLEGSCMNGAHMAGAFLNDANLNYASLTGAYLWGADLRTTEHLRSRPGDKVATLLSTSFRQADLSNARFDGNSFACTSFLGANLSGADLRSTSIKWGLDLSGAVLNCARLQGADLSRANVQVGAQRIFQDKNSKLPPVLTPIPAPGDCQIAERLYAH